MAAFTIGANYIINHISTLLETYKRGTPILKELTQNADDAGASRLDLIVGIRPNSAQVHPLLANTAIFAANNGAFSESNQDAIKKIGISDKPSDDQTIGKYGLGLKSVFHLCDALFFTGATSGISEPRSEFLSPWTPMPGDSDPAIHPTWDQAESDGANYVSEESKSLLTKLAYHPEDGYFGLWVPLRDSRQNIEHITNEYPGDADSFEEVVSWVLAVDGENELAMSLPMLRTLETINVWDAQAGQFDTPTMSLSLSPGGNRRVWDPAIPSTETKWQLDGEISSSSNHSRHYIFSGVETSYPDDQIQAIQKLPAWPQRRLPIDGSMTTVPEKANPHSAAYFVHSTSPSEPRFKVHQSVFLPVESLHNEPWKLPYSIDLVLHGYYLVNPSRTGIEFTDYGSEDDAASVAALWNNQLRNRHVLPSIVPALDQFLKDHSDLVNAPDFELLVSRVEKFLRDSEFLDSATSINQWAYEISTGENLHGWQQIPSATTLLSLFESENIDPIQIIPNLADIPPDYSLVSSSKPRIASEKIGDWDEQLLAHISELPISSFQDDASLQYIEHFLVEKRAHYAQFQAAKRSFVRSLQRYIASAPIAELIERSGRFRRILGTLAWDMTVGLQLDESKTLIHSLIQKIAVAEQDLLCVPTSWLHEGATNFQRRTIGEDVVKTFVHILDQLGRQAGTESEYQDIGNATLAIFARLDADSQIHIANQKSANIYSVFDCATSSFKLSSIAQFEESWNEKTLFRNIGFSHSQSSQLQSALALGRVLIADQETLRIGLGEIAEAIPLCNSDSIIESISTKPDLKKPEERTQILDFLLSELTATSLQNDLFLAIRYLIHSNRQAYDDVSQILVWDDNTEPVWQKIAEALTVGPDDAWKVVDAFLGDRLNPAQLEVLKIERLNQRAIQLMLSERQNISAINFGMLDSSERRTLIRSLGPESSEIVRNMTIHETVQGDLVSIDTNCYLSAATEPFPISDPLSATVTVLKRHEDSLTTNILRELAGERVWSASEAIAHALESQGPTRASASILVGLKLASSTAAIHDQLTTTKWMFDNNGAALAPDQVLYLENEQELTQELCALTDEFIAWTQLDAMFLEDEAFAVIRKHALEPTPEVIRAFGLIVDSNEEYAVGLSPCPSSVDEIMTWLGIFESIPSELMRSRFLLDRVMQNSDDESWRAIDEYLLPALRATLAPSRSLSVISFLSNRIQSSGGLTSQSRQAHRDYLLEAAHHPDFQEKVLPNIKLPNSYGVWRPTDEMSAFGENLDPIDSLSGEYRNLIGDYLPVPSSPSQPASGGPVNSATNPTEMSDFFDSWAEATSQELAGAFASLLGPSFASIATRLFESSGYHTDTIRRHFGWRSDPRPNPIGWLAEDDGVGVISTTEFVLKIESGSTGDLVTEMSVAGTYFEAKLGEIKEHLIVGRLAPPLVSLAVSEPRRVSIQLSGISADSLGVRADGVLRETIKYIWQQAYRQSEVSDDLWNVVGDQDQLHLTTVQTLISETLLDRINQYRGVDDETLKALKEEWTSLRYRQKEIPKNDPTIGRQLQDIEHKKQEIITGVETLLRNSPAVQGGLLSSVRQTVGDAQYKPDSILFELFQNADDAVWELKQLGGGPEESTFVVLTSSARITVSHWGRPLTQQRGPSKHEPKFKTDLEKMLVMHASDKSGGHGSAEITGKFGLGFKSVFLASAEPSVLSKRIGFKVIGGVYPVSLDLDTRKILRDRIDCAGFAADSATIIELPLSYAESENIVDRFRDLRGFQHVFARQIRKSEFDGKTAGWEPTSMNDIDGVEIGPVTVSGKSTNLLVIRADHGAAIAFALGTKVLQPLPEGVPSIWVTTPTQEEPRVKFAINGDFSIDPGRARISDSSEENESVARSLSVHSLTSLVSLATNMESDSSIMDIDNAPDSDELYEFWNSFWALTGIDLAVNRSGARDHDLSRLIFWGGSQPTIPALISRKQVLPTRLENDYEVLTRTGDVKYVVGGLLEIPSVFSAVSNLTLFKDLIVPGAAVSDKGVAAPLEALGHPLRRAERIDLRSFVLSVFEDSKATPKLANDVGTVIDKSLTESLPGSDSQTESEIEHLWSDLADILRFKTQDGAWCPAQDLLVFADHPEVSIDETMRAAFAPHNRLLSEEYRESGIAFFVSVRGQMHAPADLLKQWVISANEDQKQAAMKYLIDGELARQVLRAVRESDEQLWLSSDEYVKELPDIDGVFAQDIQSIFVALGSLPYGSQPLDGVYHERSPLDPKSVLEAVRDWWRIEGPDLLEKHDEELYPETGSIDLNANISAVGRDVDVRKRWIELLTLGATHTLGRVQPTQNSGFLKLMREKSWLDLVATPNADNGVWGQIFEEFFGAPSGRQDYFYWLSLLANMYQFVNWLEDYADAFIKLDRRGQVRLGTVLDPMSDTLLQGSGVEAPSLERALGYGASFVVRELMRTGVISSEDAAVHAFVPQSSTLDFLYRIRMPDVSNEPSWDRSRLIHLFLSEHLGDDAYFEGSYDIPLKLASQDPELRNRFLGLDISTN